MKKNKILKCLLVASSIVSSTALLINKEEKQIKGAIVNPGGISCDPLMDSTTYKIDGPSYISLRSGLSQDELINQIRSNFTLYKTTTKCLSSGNTSYTTTELDNSNLKITLENENDLKYSLSYGNITSYVTISIILDTYAPVMNGLSTPITSNVNNPILVETLKSSIIAIDDVDGEVEVYIVEDTYTGNEKVLGTYYVTFGAKDNTGNISTFKVTINTIDDEQPTLIGPSSISSYMSSPLSIDDILNKFEAKDNVDSSLQVYVKEDNFTSHEQEKGEYIVILYTIDNSNNVSKDYEVSINTIDDIAPTIEASTLSITTSPSTKINDEYLKSLLVVDDNTDKNNCSIELIEDTYLGNSYNIGTYHKSFVALDSSNNESSIVTIEIIVSDIEAPIFYIPTTILTDKVLTESDIVAIMSSSYGIDLFSYTYSVVSNDYQNNTSAPGIYTVEYKFKDKEQQSSFILSANIEVLKKQNKKEVNAWNKFLTFFPRLFKSIISFFKKIF